MIIILSVCYLSYPGLLGGLLSVLLAGIATPESYDKYSAGMADKRFIPSLCTVLSMAISS